MNYYIIMRKDGTIDGEETKPIKVFTDMEEAIEFVETMRDPLMLRSAWEFVGEGTGRIVDDKPNLIGVYYWNCGRSFEYENTHNGEIREIEYYIDLVQQ